MKVGDTFKLKTKLSKKSTGSVKYISEMVKSFLLEQLTKQIKYYIIKPIELLGKQGGCSASAI